MGDRPAAPGQKWPWCVCRRNASDARQPVISRLALTVIAESQKCPLYWRPRQFCNKQAVSKHLVCPAAPNSAIERIGEFSALSSIAVDEPVTLVTGNSAITTSTNREKSRGTPEGATAATGFREHAWQYTRAAL